MRSHPVAAPRPTVLLVATLGLLSAVSPLATDMYLPAFPELTEDLGTSTSGVQLTLTAFMIGLGTGQLVIGSVSDAVGRRAPLLAGTLICLLASIACAVAPNIGVLIAARLVQGFSGAAGVVIARAVITDVTTGARTVQLMNVMMIIGGLMPVVAPVLGGAILEVATWRAIFWAIALLVAVMIVGVALVTGESLPPASRHAGGLATTLANLRTVLRSRGYVAATLVYGLSFGAMFAYISASPFVIQNLLGLSTLAYSLVFGINAAGMALASLLSVRLAGRVAVHRTLGAGVGGLLLSSLALLLVVLAGTGTVPVLVLLFCVSSSMGLVRGNAAALAMRTSARTAGTGSALMGALQFALGATVSPLVGIAGAFDARPMAITMSSCALLAGLAYLGVVREQRRPVPR